MKRAWIFFLWLALSFPAIRIGKVWESHTAPGPVVSVQFADGSVDGRLLYKLDGTEWLVTESAGIERPLRGREVVASIPNQKIITDWRGIAPLLFVTALLFGYLANRHRSTK